MNGYVFLPAARDDLEDIRAYIAEDNPDAADRVIDEIREAVTLLATMPHTGHHRPDLADRPLRFWLVRSYLIAYVPDAIPLPVVAIVHGRRNPRRLAAILRGRTA